MKKLILSTLTLCSAILVYAQQEIPKTQVFTGLSFGYSKDLKTVSMPVALSHSIAGNPHFRYIAGVRQNLAFGAAEFTFNEQKTWIDDISNYSINILGGLEYQFDNKLTCGFTVDLIGGTVGTRSYKTVGTDPVYSVSPESINLLFSKGTLNNEVYVGYKLSNTVTAKVGFSAYRLGLLYSNQKTPSITDGIFLYLPYVHLQYSLWDH